MTATELKNFQPFDYDYNYKAVSVALTLAISNRFSN